MRAFQGIAILMTGYFSSLLGNTITWDLKTLYGINQGGFALIINDARSHFQNSPNDTVVIDIDSGRYDIGGNGSFGINLVAGMQPGAYGRLIFQGAGMNKTTLVFVETNTDMIHGQNVYRTEFRDIHMTRPVYTVTQGIVVSVAPGEIVIDINTGFPTPLDIWQDGNQGRFLRRYTNSLTDPQVIRDNNDQVAYGWRDGVAKKPEPVQGNRWRFYLNNSGQVLNNYSSGELVGVKSKHEGGTYWMSVGDELVFRNIKWTHSSRGVARGGFNNVKIIGCRIERGLPINGQAPCMSTPSGGPQMNQYSPDPTSTGMVFEDYYCDSPGDDCAAFFNVNGGKVLHCTLRNSFARGIMISQEAFDICVVGSTIPNSPIELESKGTIVRTPIEIWSVDEALAAGIIHDSCNRMVTTAATPTLSPSRSITVAQGRSALTISTHSGIRQVIIYGIDGKLIRKMSATGIVATLNTEFLSKRVYLVQVKCLTCTVNQVILMR
jgi:hypothetical protein